MDNQNYNNDNMNHQETVVKPIVERRDFADKTIDAVENFIETKDHSKDYTNEELDKYKTQAIASYIPFVSLYFVFTKKYKESSYLLFHVNQGFVITIICSIVGIIDFILSAIFSSMNLVLNSMPFIVSLPIYILYFLIFLLILFGLSNASNNISRELPVVGKFKLLK